MTNGLPTIVVPEGAEREPETVRDAEERREKAASFYENVHPSPTATGKGLTAVPDGLQVPTKCEMELEQRSDGSVVKKVWYEYGCV